MLDVGCGSGSRLAHAEAAGIEPFGVATEPDDARRNAPGAYVVADIGEVPPHRFDLICLPGGLGEHQLRNTLHTLANKNAFGLDTILIVLAAEDAIPGGLESVLRELRFRDVSRFEKAGEMRLEARGSDFPLFMQERYVPGTWSEVAAYEHLPRYAFAGELARGARVLDFGCGSGYGSASLARVAQSVTGLDISNEALEFARAQHAAANLTFVQDSEFGASLPTASFELIVCFEVIEHLDSRSQATLLPSLRRLLAPCGKVIISTPNPDVTALYGENPYHLRELTYDQFAALLQEHFPHLAILEQSVMAGVFLQPSVWSDTIEVRYALDGMDGPSRPAIFVAVCGSEPFGTMPARVYPDRGRDFIRTRIAALSLQDQYLIARYSMAKLHAGLDRAEAGRLAAQDVIQLVQADCRRLERELAAGQAEAAAVLEDRSLLQATYEAELGRASRSAEALKAAQALDSTRLSEITALRAEIADRSGPNQIKLSRLARLYRNTATERDTARLALHEAAAAISDAAATLSEAHKTIAARDGRIGCLTEALVEARAVSDGLAAEVQALQARLELSRYNLDQIETSTSWRAVRRAAPLIEAAKPVLTPLLRGKQWVAQQVTGRVAPAVATAGLSAAELPPTPPELPAPPEPELFPDVIELETSVPLAARDLERETSLEPVWDERRGAFVLLPDIVSAKQDHPANLTRPYAVMPVAPVDPARNRKRILHIIPNVHVGGSTQLVIDLVQHLSSAYQHEVLTSSLWPGGAHDGLVVHHVAAASSSELAAVINGVMPDLVHLHYWGLMDDPWYHAAVAVLADHPIPALQNINTPVVPLVNNAFSHYVFVSEYVRKTFGAEIVGRFPTSVIHPGIDLRKFGDYSPAADRDDAIGMVYRLEDDKLNRDSIDVFIEIVKRRPQTKVYIIGGGRLLEPFIERTEQHGVRENFRFTGYVSYETLPGWYDRFSIFIAPVWKESFGQVAPFAMCKRAVVAGFAIGALPEILGNEETLGRTVAEAADIVVGLMDDPDRLHIIGDLNRARALAMFDVSVMTARYEAIYQTLLEG